MWRVGFHGPDCMSQAVGSRCSIRSSKRKSEVPSCRARTFRCPSQFRHNSALGHALWFGQSGDMPSDAVDLSEGFIGEVFRRRSFDGNIAVKPFLARSMASRHAELFDSVCEFAMDGLR